MRPSRGSLCARGGLAAAALVASCSHPRSHPGDAAVPAPRVLRELPEPAPIAPPPGAGVQAFPFVPAGCGYTVRAVSPGQPPVAPHDERYGTDALPRNLHLTFVGDPSVSIVVQWSTGNDTLASEVHFGRVGGPRDQRAWGYSFAYGGSGRRREHEVHLCGLAPGTRYEYDAGGGDHRSPVYRFTTAPAVASQVRALVVGDARSDPATWGLVARTALAERPDLMLFTGDAVNDGANQGRWDAFFSESVELFATTPGLWADGNHEGISEVYFAQFAFPENGTPRRHEHWYATTYGPMRVIVLNDTTVPSHDITGIERDWLRGELAAVDRERTPWVITMHHQPLFTTSDGHVSDSITRGAWEPLFDHFHVDADLAGHVHSYESSLPIVHGEPTDDPRGTRYFNFGGGGAPLYRFRPPERWVLTRESTHGFAILTVDATSLTWDARRTDGSRIERLELRR